MAIVVGPVEAVFDADAAGFKKGVDQARDALGRFTSEAGKLSGFLQGLGFGPKFAANFATVSTELKKVSTEMALLAGGLVGAGIFAAKAASDFEQTGSLIERIFGEGADDVEEFARVTSDELGLSVQEAREGLANLGAQLKNSLGDTAAAEEQSKALIKLAADVSAAMNVPFADTLARIQSGLRGETEAIEKLNIFIGESSLKQEALRQGIGKSTEQMTEQEKTQLRLSAIFRQTADLTGAAAAESESFAGQTARLQASIKNLAVEFGQALLPAATDLVAALRDAVEWFRGLSDGAKSTIVAMGGVTAAMAGSAFAVGQVGGAVEGLTALWKAGDAAAKLFGTTLKSALSTAAVAAVTFTIAYEGTSAILDHVGLRSVPKNVSVLDELTGALGEVAAGGKSLARVWVNAWATIAATVASAVFLLTSGFVDLRDEIDGLVEKAHTAIDEIGEQEELQAQFEHSTKVIRDAAAAADGMTEEMDANGQSMGDAAKAGATLAERVAQAGREQREAEKATRKQTKALEEQAKAIREAAAFAVKLEDELAALAGEETAAGAGGRIVGLEQERRRARAEAMTRGAEAGLGTAVLEDVARSIDELFLKKIGTTLADLPAEQFVDAIGFAEDRLDALGFSLSELLNASPKLASRFDQLGKGAGQAAEAVEEVAEGLAQVPSSLADLFGGLATSVLSSVKIGGKPLGEDAVGEIAARIGGALSGAISGDLDLGAIAETIGAVGGAALGSVLPGIGTAIGAEVGSILVGLLGDVASGIQQVLGLVGKLGAKSEVLGTVFSDLSDAAGPLYALFVLVGAAVGALSFALGPLGPIIGAFAVLMGALVIVTGSLITQTEGFARAQQAIATLAQQLVAPFEALGAKTAAFVALFSHVLEAFAPVLRILAATFGEALLRGLFEGMKLTAIAFISLAKVIADIYNLFVEEEDRIATGAMGDALDEIKDLDFDEAVKEGTQIEAEQGLFDQDERARVLQDAIADVRYLGDESATAAENMTELNEELRNAASDFKVAAFRFQAQDVAGADAAAGGDRAGFAGARGSVVQFILQNALIQANDPMDLLDGIEKETRRRAIRRRGSNFGRPDYNGRWEG